MRRWKAVYVGAILLAGYGCVAANFFYTGDKVVLSAISVWLLAVLTFPLGSLASVIGLYLTFTGTLTPLEMIFVMTPVYAALGYIQWWRILPGIYRKRAIGDLENEFR